MWDATGHMVTVSIAESRLEPAVRGEVDRLVGILAGFEPTSSELVPTATWMDRIKHFDRGLLAFDDWHYFDQPFNPFGLPGVEAPSEQNVVWAIGEAARTVGSPVATDFEKALMLRMLIHFVGDLHQPLHMTNRITPEHPAGDFGGNLFSLSGNGPDNLHSFWDGTAGLFPYVDPQRDWSAIDGFARRLEKEVAPPDSTVLTPRGSREIADWIAADARLWALESYRDGVEAYEGIEPGTVPRPAYVERARTVVARRLAWGGYRLAAILNVVVAEGMRDAG